VTTKMVSEVSETDLPDGSDTILAAGLGILRTKLSIKGRSVVLCNKCNTHASKMTCHSLKNTLNLVLTARNVNEIKP